MPGLIRYKAGPMPVRWPDGACPFTRKQTGAHNAVNIGLMTQCPGHMPEAIPHFQCGIELPVDSCNPCGDITSHTGMEESA